MGRASESVESNEVHAFAINRTADRRLTSHVDIVRRSNTNTKRCWLVALTAYSYRYCMVEKSNSTTSRLLDLERSVISRPGIGTVFCDMASTRIIVTWIFDVLSVRMWSIPA